MRRRIARLAVGALAALSLGAPIAHAQSWPWPSDEAVRAALERHPAWQAAQQQREAERIAAPALRQGHDEWRLAAGLQRLRDGRTPLDDRGVEVTLERSLRLPGKRDAYDALARARLEQADQQMRRQWAELARRLLDDWGMWWREAETARQLAAQAQLFGRERAALERREALGDASRADVAAAALAESESRALAEAQADKARLLRDLLQLRHPGLDVPEHAPAIPMPEGLPSTPAPRSLALDDQPALRAARAEAATSLAQARVDALEQRADPAIGLRLQSWRERQERSIGWYVSLAFGGSQREAQARAQAARAGAEALRADHVERETRLAAWQSAIEAEHGHEIWRAQQRNASAAAQQADLLARGLALGEGSLAELLRARRRAGELELAASLAAIDHHLALAQRALAEGRRWAPPTLEPAAPH